jgi:glycosyltransferase involved in cell wall biosynthesis
MIQMNDNERPLVSVIMNCFNGEKYLREAIDSIISQTYENWEIIFWDNRSTDKSAEIVKEYNDSRIKYYLSPEHTDIGCGRVNAFPLLTGKFIAILDTDDLWLPHKLEEQLRCFHDKNVGICITNTEFFSSKQSKVLYKSPPKQGWVTDALLRHYYISLETVMLRRSVVESLEYAFDQDFSHISDFDLILRTSTVSKLAYVDKILGKWRVHGSSGSWSNPEFFVLEKKKWLLKNKDNNLFASYQLGMKILNNNTNIQWVKYLIVEGRAKEARTALKNIKLNSAKAFVVYAMSFFSFIRYFLIFRHQRQKNYWF